MPIDTDRFSSDAAQRRGERQSRNVRGGSKKEKDEESVDSESGKKGGNGKDGKLPKETSRERNKKRKAEIKAAEAEAIIKAEAEAKAKAEAEAQAKEVASLPTTSPPESPVTPDSPAPADETSGYSATGEPIPLATPTAPEVPVAPEAPTLEPDVLPADSTPPTEPAPTPTPKPLKPSPASPAPATPEAPTSTPETLKPLASLREIVELAQDPELKDREFYLSSIKRARDVLKETSGLTIMPDKPTMVLSDIHARPEMLAAALSMTHEDFDNKTVYQLLEEGRINLALVGDLLHSEKRENWTSYENIIKNQNKLFQKLNDYRDSLPDDQKVSKTEDEARKDLRDKDPDFSFLEQSVNSNEDLMRAEMARGLAVEKIVADLTVRFFKNFYVVRGNHDDVNGQIGRKGEIVRVDVAKYIDEGKDTRNWLIDNFQQEFVDTLAGMENNLPLIVFNKGVIVAHTFDANGVSFREVQDRSHSITDRLTWSKPLDIIIIPEEKEKLESNIQKIKKVLGIPNAVFIAGHQRVSVPSKKYNQPVEGMIQINDKKRMIGAFVPEVEKFNPDKDVFEIVPLPPLEKLPVVVPDTKPIVGPIVDSLPIVIPILASADALTNPDAPKSPDISTDDYDIPIFGRKVENIPPKPESVSAESEPEPIVSNTLPIFELPELSPPPMGAEILLSNNEQEEPPAPLPEKKKGFFASLKEKADRFVRKNFKGEVVEEDIEVSSPKTETAKYLAVFLLDSLAKWRGVKAFYDVPRFVFQSIFTAVERRKIMKVWRKKAEGEIELPISEVEGRVNLLKERLQSSKYFTAEQRTKIQNQIDAILVEFQEGETTDEQQLDKNIAKLIEDNVKIHLQKMEVARQTVNTLLMFSGVTVVRGITYGVLAGVDRWQRVAKERNLPEEELVRREGQFKEVFINGSKEWWSGLMKKDVDIWDRPVSEKQKKQNFWKSAGTVAMFAGFGLSGLSEINNEGLSQPIESLFDKILDAWNKKSTGDLGQMAEINLDHSLFGVLHKLTDGGGDPEPDFPNVEPQADYGSSKMPVEPILEPTGGTVEMTEDFKKVLEAGTVHKGSGIVELIQNQLRLHPDKFGFRGGDLDKWIASEALKIARVNGIVTGSGDLRLIEDAAHPLAVVLKDGHVAYLDAHTGQAIPDSDLSKFFYQHSYRTGADVYPDGRTVGGGGQVAIGEQAPTVPSAGSVEPGGGVVVPTETAGTSFADSPAYKNGNPEAKKYLDALQSKLFSELPRPDELPPVDVGYLGDSESVKALALQQGLILNERGIDAPGEFNDAWFNRVRDASGNLSDVLKLQISRVGEVLVAKFSNSDGSTDTLSWQNGAIVGYDREVPQAFTEALSFGKRLVRHANAGYRSFVEKVEAGDFSVRQALSSELPRPSGEGMNALADHGLKLSGDGTGIEALGSRGGDNLDWDKIFVGNKGEGVVKVNQVLFDTEGKSLFVRLFNSDGSVDLVRYVGSKIKDFDRIPNGSSKSLETLRELAGNKK